MRLQVDAIDGFFGGNLSLTNKCQSQEFQSRLRILHQSAHFVDGHYIAGRWNDNRAPIPYTRDFGELVVAHILHPSTGVVRYYGGASYATLVRPTVVERFAYLAGIELALDHLIGSIDGQPTNTFIAYNVTLSGTPVYAATHQVQVGLKFGNWFEKGPSVFLAYYTGRDMFGEYFDERITTLGAGFTVDFF